MLLMKDFIVCGYETATQWDTELKVQWNPNTSDVVKDFYALKANLYVFRGMKYIVTIPSTQNIFPSKRRKKARSW